MVTATCKQATKNYRNGCLENLTTKGVVLHTYPCAQEAELGGWYAPYQSKVCNLSSQHWGRSRVRETSRSYIGPCVYIPGWPQTPHDLQLLICSSQVHLQRAGTIIISRISGLFSTRDQSQGLVHVTQADHQRVPFPDTIYISFVFWGKVSLCSCLVRILLCRSDWPRTHGVLHLPRCQWFFSRVLRMTACHTTPDCFILGTASQVAWDGMNSLYSRSSCPPDWLPPNAIVSFLSLSRRLTPVH